MGETACAKWRLLPSFCDLSSLTTWAFLPSSQPLFLTIANNDPFEFAPNTMASLPNPDNVWALQNWPAPAGLGEAKDWLAFFCSGETRCARNNDSHPEEKIAKVIDLAHALWSEMEQDAMDDLIASGRTDAAHLQLL